MYSLARSFLLLAVALAAIVLIASSVPTADAAVKGNAAAGGRFASPLFTKVKQQEPQNGRAGGGGANYRRLTELLHIDPNDPNEDIRTNVLLNMEGI